MTHTRNISFGGSVLLLGCGSVSQCLQPLLLRHLTMDFQKLTILDMVDRRDTIPDTLSAGASYVRHTLTQDNLESTLEQYVGAGDLVINLTWNIDGAQIVEWCHDNGVLYVDTALEAWESAADLLELRPTERTLYAAHMEIRELRDSWDEPGPTAVVEHGANPGLVSHWTKVALEDITNEILKTGGAAEQPTVSVERRERLESALAAPDYARLAMETGVKVIHISERDTQISKQPKEVGEFVNTWSVKGLFEEGIGPAELGWGTHELNLPDLAYVHESGPRNQICLARPGSSTWVKSWVPLGGPITGMMIQHGEAFTISDHLTVWDEGVPVYRPTVHYAYLPTDAAIASLHEYQMQGFQLQTRHRIMNDDILSGRDELGVLLLGHDLNGWWTGSQLSIEETRQLVPHQNATTLQVAASLLGAISWIVRHPDRGLCVPDDIDHHEVLSVADPYLGERVSVPTNWRPTAMTNPFAGFDGARSGDDPWQLRNFLVR
ncbi:saccharopine dehydrogenase NADP-binding domain-containing protein [Lipingzhangella sp. LS1_29]|uniref:Saccharopine dehydrogenase NADP-binding domain-containing protein n=1 Tax=Lipingzhangella rawalii TaxID=2055835 RepID=A0ABU2H8A6_9ACTN|nr:saccharopine dehydrogenase NADP-binding domain-containing protein [Lipingzhangella rawalii]MDS1271540.1 saccharopine dehydrogenase NADP-binding domain-containing protein [Lipingzhangella rawalii]